MKNSLIFLRSNTKGTYNFVHYDCCESLGANFHSNKVSENIMYVGIPIKELDTFFTVNNNQNIANYLHLITIGFDINYSLATSEDIATINVTNCGFEKDALIFIKVNTKGVSFSNKYFNVAYNTMRYLWYHNYTNMAIIATNLYNSHIIEDPMDIFAIAFSFQQGTDRAVLPSNTLELEGLLFFRPKEDVISELLKNVPFNSVFFKYPIYFNPIVKIRGTFFEDSEATIEAKQLFSKMTSIDNIDDIPKFMRNNIKIVYDDYLLMKHSYLQIKNYLDKSTLNIARINPLLLSKDITSININAVDAMGYGKKVSIEITPISNKLSFDLSDINVNAKKEMFKKMEDSFTDVRGTAVRRDASVEMFSNSDPW